LDELVAEIQRLVDSGELFERSSPVDIDALDDDDLVLLAEALGVDLDELEDEFLGDDTPGKKYLQ
jgi:hypothetical protein